MPKTVEVFSLSRSVRTGELTFVEFMQMPQLSYPAEREQWNHPFNDGELVVRHIEPVCAVQTPEGRRYLAIEPKLFDLLSYAVDARMAKKLAGAEAQIKHLEKGLEDERQHAERQHQRAARLANDYELARGKLNDIAWAGVGKRLKYLFTGSFK